MFCKYYTILETLFTILIFSICLYISNLCRYYKCYSCFAPNVCVFFERKFNLVQADMKNLFVCMPN